MFLSRFICYSPTVIFCTICVFLVELVDLGLHDKGKEDERKKQVFHRDI